MILDTIKELIANQFAVDEDAVTLDVSFTDDLGADSLDIAELTMALEEEFSLPEVPEEELKKILTVGDLVDYISKVVGD